MLLRFTCQNYLSFRDEVVLDMQPSSKERNHPDHVVDLGGGLKALRVAALYGANASGKSNLLKAMRFFTEFVGRPPDVGKSIPFGPFRLERMSLESPSVFSMLFAVDGEAYELGFAITAARVVEEWLYRGGRTELYRRVSGSETVITDAGRAFFQRDSSFLEVWKRRTPSNALLLSEGARIEVEVCKRLLAAVAPGGLSIQPGEGLLESIERLAHQQPKYLDAIAGLIRGADTGISSLVIRMVKSWVPDMHKDAVRVVEAERPTLRTQRAGAGFEEPVEFPLTDESEGTNRLISLSPIMFYAGAEQSSAFLVDELERSLHPLLSRMFLEQFLATSGQSQLIFATHETNLLDLELLRRDEIHFISKDRSGNSERYSLVDFDVRKDLKVEKNYLIGRFGAIPFLGEASRIGIAEKAEGE